jgi:hypothetical protein
MVTCFERSLNKPNLCFLLTVCICKPIACQLLLALFLLFLLVLHIVLLLSTPQCFSILTSVFLMQLQTTTIQVIMIIFKLRSCLEEL